MILELIGAEKYAEELEILEKIKAQEEEKGSFEVIEDDIDRRDNSLKDMELS